MGERWRSGSTPRTEDAIVRVVERQWGVASRRQLEDAGLGKAATVRWMEGRRLHRIHPGVYAAGHRGLAVEGEMAAALLYAGPGAMLSHCTAGWWSQLLPHRPSRIDVSSARRRSSSNSVRMHCRRDLERTWHRRLPITQPSQTLLDIACVVPFNQLRRALAEAEYRRLVGLDDVEAVLGRGRPGSAALRKALAQHRPELARTLSVLEERFLQLCESHDLAPPEVNAEVAGLMVDALWRRQRVIVELDGHAAHGTPAAMERDHGRDLTLRAAGFRVLRYTWQQITGQPQLVAADLAAALLRRPDGHGLKGGSGERA